MSYRIILEGAQPAINIDSKLINGAKLRFYDYDSLLPAPVYTSYKLITSMGNEVVASNGFFPEMWAHNGQAYRVEWLDAQGSLIHTYDRIDAGTGKDILEALGTGLSGLYDDVNDALSQISAIEEIIRQKEIAITAINTAVAEKQEMATDAANFADSARAIAQGARNTVIAIKDDVSDMKTIVSENTQAATGAATAAATSALEVQTALNDTTTGLASKASIQSVTQLQTQVDAAQSTLTFYSTSKADKTYVDGQLNLKLSTADFNSFTSTYNTWKAGIDSFKTSQLDINTNLQGQITGKASTTLLNTQISRIDAAEANINTLQTTTATTAYVDGQLTLKASASDVSQIKLQLSGFATMSGAVKSSVDAVSGRVLTLENDHVTTSQYSTLNSQINGASGIASQISTISGTITNLTANKADVSYVDTKSAQIVAKISAGRWQNINAGFDTYDTATGVPTGWLPWNAPNATRVADGSGGYACQISGSATAGLGTGIYFAMPARANAWIVKYIKFRLDAGTLQGAILYDSNGQHMFFASAPDAYGVTQGNGVVGQTYVFSKLIKATGASADVIIWASSDSWVASQGGGANNANKLSVFECGWDYATDAEIQANKALNDPLGTGVTLSSAITTEQNARANGDSANASAIAGVAAKINVNANLFPYPYPRDLTTNPVDYGWRNAIGNVWIGSGNFGISSYYFFDRLSDGNARIVDASLDIPVTAYYIGETVTLSYDYYVSLSATPYTRVEFLDSAKNAIYSGAWINASRTGNHHAASWTYNGSTSYVTNGFIRVWFDVTYDAVAVDTYQFFLFMKIKLEFGLTETMFTLEGSNAAIQAQTSINQSAIADVKGSMAQVEVLAAASGSDPAVVRIKSGYGGSEVSLAAKVLSLINYTTGGIISVMKAVGGYVFFQNPISIDVGTKRLTLGANANVVLWFGNATVAPPDQTIANSNFCLGTDGKVYYGSSEVVSGSVVASAKAGVQASFGNDIASANWGSVATSGTLSITNCPANGLAVLSGAIGFEAVSGNDCTVKLRLKINGVVVQISDTAIVMSGGIPQADAELDSFLNYTHLTALPSGTNTFVVEAQRTQGSGVVRAIGNLMVTVTAS